MISFPSQLDDKEQILRMLGGFWNDTYQGADLLAETLQARSTLTKQTFERLQEAIDCRSRLDIPVFRKEYWRSLTLKRSVANSFPDLYGENVLYNSGTQYGKRSVPFPFVYPIDAELFDCKLVSNRITSPSVNLVNGLDFVIDKDRSIIIIDQNPFDNELFQKTVSDIDEEVTLWLYKPSIDRQYVYQHFGYVINLWAKSSQEYKNFLNDIYDSMVSGTSVGRTLDAITKTTGVPLAKGNETVEFIGTDNHNLLVLTDKHVYKFVKTANALVSVGDHLKPDQAITDSLMYYEFNRGQVPTDVNGVSLPKDLLPGKYVGELGFGNKPESVVLDYDLEGRAKVSFVIGGHPFDVEDFWNEVHARGVLADKTLADTLDNRTIKVGEPSASNLPSTINPFEFLAQNFLRYGAFLVKIKSSDVMPGSLGLDKLSYVKRLLPPHTTMLLIVEMSSIEGSIVFEEDDPEGGISSFRAANNISSEITTDSFKEVIQARIVRGFSL